MLAQLQAELGLDRQAKAVDSSLFEQKPALWLCSYFPELPVDALQIDSQQPLVVTESLQSRLTVISCNRPAAEAGVAAGMSLSSAMALTDALQIQVRDRLLEQACLQNMLDLAWQFSDQVVALTEQALVFEVRGSLRLFGGFKKLLKKIRRAFNETQIQHRISVAPSMQAAYWLNLCDRPLLIQDVGQLKSALRDLPLALLLDNEKKLKRLQRSGIHNINDLMRLPRKDAARRFGPELFQQLDAALCLRPEVFKRYRPDETFSAAHEFYAPTEKLNFILSAAEALLKKLHSFLTLRQSAVQQFDCYLQHEYYSPTHIVVGMSQYSNQWRSTLR